MFKIFPLSKRLCNCGGPGECTNYSIWGLWQKKPIKTLLKWLDGCAPCRPEYFPLVYWLVLIIAVIGIGFCAYEMVCVYGGSKCLSTFRDRSYFVLNFTVRRNARIIGAFLKCNHWAYLLYGMLSINPELITYWMTIHWIIIIAEISLWTIEILTNEIPINCNTLVSLALFLSTYYLVKCVRDAFLIAIEHNEIKELNLFLVKN